jgi:hypothetical protein
VPAPLATLATEVARRLGGDINADLVPVLETVGDGLGRRVNSQRHSLDRVLFDAVGECVA